VAQPLQWMISLFDGLTGPASKITSSVETMSGAMEKAHRTTGGFESGLTKLSSGLNVAGRAFDVVSRAAHVTFDVLGEIGKNRATQGIFEDMLGADEGAGVLSWLGQIRKSTAFTRDQLEGLAQPLAEFFKGDDLKRVIVAGLDVGRGDINRTTAALDAFAKVASTGKISSKAFKTLGLTGPDFERLGAGAGGEASITTARLLSMIAGKNASGKLGDRSLQASDTLDAKINQLRGAPGELWEKLSDSPALPRITAAIGKFTDVITSPAVIDSLARVLEKMGDQIPMVFEKLAELVERVDWAAVADGLGSIAGILARFGVGSAQKVATAVTGTNESGEKVGFFSRLSAAASSINPLAMFLGGDIDSGAQKDIAKKQGQDVVAGFMEGITLARQAFGLRGVGAAMGADVHQGVAQELEIKSPSRVLRQIGWQTVEGFALGIESQAGRVGSVLDRAFGVEVPPIDLRTASAFAIDDVAAASSLNGNGRPAVSFAWSGDVVIQGSATPEERKAIGDEFEERARAVYRGLIEEFGLEGA
jgi:hypothetical protein